MDQASALLVVGPADIHQAADRLKGSIVQTPLLDYPLVSARLGFRLLIKAETLQVTGSFKFRGATNRLLAAKAHDPSLRAVVAFSSGNHAQGVAAAAKVQGLKATIVMPSDAPAIKIANTKGYGAEVVFYQRQSEDRESIAQAIAARDGGIVVPPYDDPFIIAGQGTVGLEIAKQVQELGVIPDRVIVPCSGGGLVGGVATAIKDVFPDVAVYAAEPQGYDDLRRSLAAGERISNAPTAPSICDALMAEKPGALTFPIHRRWLAGSEVVSDAAVINAMSFAQRHLKLVLEPGGAAGLAAALQAKEKLAGLNVVIVCSGGNVDPEMIKRAADCDDPLVSFSKDLTQTATD